MTSGHGLSPGACWVAASICVALACTPAMAQDTPDGDPETLGGPRLDARLRATGYHADNFFYQQHGGTSVSGFVLNPTLLFRTQSRKLRFSGSAKATHGTFDVPGEADDYLDYSADLDLNMLAGKRNRFVLGADFKYGHDPFGTERTESGAIATRELDQFERAQGWLGFRYGVPGATFNTELTLRGLDKRYVTNRSGAVGTRFLDYQSITADYTMFYRYSPKTSLVIDVLRSDIDFDVPFGAVDRRSGILYRALLGFRWLATAKTSGDVRIGGRLREFDSGASSLRRVDWSAGVEWLPTALSLIELRSGRAEQASYLSNARIVDIQFGLLKWSLKWSTRFKTHTEIERSRVNFFGGNRRDQLLSGGIGFEYQALSTLVFVGDAKVTDRSSSTAAREFERVFGHLGIRLDL